MRRRCAASAASKPNTRSLCPAAAPPGAPASPMLTAPLTPRFPRQCLATEHGAQRRHLRFESGAQRRLGIRPHRRDLVAYLDAIGLENLRDWRRGLDPRQKRLAAAAPHPVPAGPEPVAQDRQPGAVAFVAPFVQDRAVEGGIDLKKLVERPRRGACISCDFFSEHHLHPRSTERIVPTPKMTRI